jgi:hypothetical protein
MASQVERSISARQSELTGKLHSLEALIEEAECPMAESQSEMERWLEHASACSQAMMNAGARAI